MTRDNLEEELQLLLILGELSVVFLDKGNSSLRVVVDDRYTLHESRCCTEVFPLQPGRGISVEEAVFQAQLLEEPSCVG